MHKERRAAVNIATEQTQTFVSRVPRLHDDVIQFVAQEVVHHMFIAVFNFEEVGQHASRSTSTAHCTRLEQPAYRLGGISVLSDDRFQRALLANQTGILRAEGVEVLLGADLSRPCLVEHYPLLINLGRQSFDPLRRRFELQSKLPALSAESFQLLMSGGGFLLEAARLAIQRRDA